MASLSHIVVLALVLSTASAAICPSNTEQLVCTAQEAKEYCVAEASCNGCLFLSAEEQTRYFVCTCPEERSLGDGKVSTHDGTGCAPAMCPTSRMAATPPGVTMTCGTDEITGKAFPRCDRSPDTLVFNYKVCGIRKIDLRSPPRGTSQPRTRRLQNTYSSTCSLPLHLPNPTSPTQPHPRLLHDASTMHSYATQRQLFAAHDALALCFI